MKIYKIFRYGLTASGDFGLLGVTVDYFRPEAVDRIINFLKRFDIYCRTEIIK